MNLHYTSHAIRTFQRVRADFLGQKLSEQGKRTDTARRKETIGHRNFLLKSNSDLNVYCVIRNYYLNLTCILRIHFIINLQVRVMQSYKTIRWILSEAALSSVIGL